MRGICSACRKSRESSTAAGMVTAAVDEDFHADVVALSKCFGPRMNFSIHQLKKT